MDYRAAAGPGPSSAAAKEKAKLDFERTLAGASVEKAGVTRDQTEINRIIAEASKGSKFYLRQVEKDKILNGKIAWIQAKRDELMQMANVAQLEAHADKLLAALEAGRDLSQVIVHVDMDAFFAAVETDKDPSLRGKAFGVGKGVLTTASYEARKFGVRSGMAGFVAKKLCPHLIFVDPHFDAYIEVSREVTSVLRTVDPSTMMAGVDEGYLNITSYMAQHSLTAAEVVTRLRTAVFDKTRLTISAGIAPNRMLAKICSDINKPNGQYELRFEGREIRRFMKDLPIRKIPGCGRVAERLLESIGVMTCGDIYTKRAVLAGMDHWFGLEGLLRSHLGLADNRVEPGKRENRKSVGHERTFKDKSTNEDILEKLEEIAASLEEDMLSSQYAGRTITVKYKSHDYKSFTRARTIGKWIQTSDDILPIARELLIKELPLRIRLLGIRMSNLRDLTRPDTGIQGYFGAPGAAQKPQVKRKNSGPNAESPKKVKTSDEVIEIDLDDDEEDEAELDEWVEADFVPSESMASTVERKHLLGPVCPVCSRALGAGVSNETLNAHVDKCLQGLNTSTPLSPTRTDLATKVAQAAEQRARGAPAPTNIATSVHAPKPEMKALRNRDAFATLMKNRR